MNRSVLSSHSHPPAKPGGLYFFEMMSGWEKDKDWSDMETYAGDPHLVVLQRRKLTQIQGNLLEFGIYAIELKPDGVRWLRRPD